MLNSTNSAKIRWRGPAKVVCVEEKDGKPQTYWLAHKTQLIRAAPHHVRPDFTAIEDTAVENLKDATQTLQQLKSRGVTRFIDLNKANKNDLWDVEEHEEEISADEGPDSKQRRIEEAPINDGMEYTPSEPPEPSETTGNPSFPAPAPEPPEPTTPGPMQIEPRDPSELLMNSPISQNPLWNQSHRLCLTLQ